MGYDPDVFLRASPDSRARRSRRSLFALVGLFIVSCCQIDRAHADGGATFLSTGGADSLLTESLPFFIDDLGRPVQISVEFGFGTNEALGPGTIFDSFTLSIADASGASVWILANVDAGGLVIAPPTPGSLPISGGDIAVSSIPSPLFNAEFANLFDYSLTASVPQALLGSDATIYFDLFDNQNGINSRGWFSNFSVVPESASSTLALIGLVFVALFGRFKPRSRCE